MSRIRVQFICSSRRRHTRWPRDWSSDVCSSDLESVHAGDEIVDSVKDNDSMEWHFLDQDKAMDQLKKGDLFAVVVIPEDFSKSLGTVLQAHPEKANVEYYVNEKLNAIAPKITEKGASVIVEEVSRDRKSTRLNSSHVASSYAVFCWKKKKRQ